jgi:hypothetical protein
MVRHPAHVGDRDNFGCGRTYRLHPVSYGENLYSFALLSSPVLSFPEQPVAKMAENYNAVVQIEPLLLDKREAARVLGMGTRTFEDLVLAELIGKVKIGGLTLYDVEDLRAFVRRVRREGLTKSRIEDLIEKGKRRRQSAAGRESA